MKTSTIQIVFAWAILIHYTDSQENICLAKPGGRCISKTLSCGPGSIHSGYCCSRRQCCIDCYKDDECLAKPNGRCGAACFPAYMEIQDGTCCGDQQVCCKILPCSLNPCLNDGTCIENGDTFTCTCLYPYTGQYCERLINCDDLPCQNFGQCMNFGSDYVCKCPNLGTLRFCGDRSCTCPLTNCTCDAWWKDKVTIHFH